MRVVCTRDNLDAINNPSIRERLREDIHIEGPISPLTIGDEYFVQALELRKNNVWIFLHITDDLWWPTPYPAELFDFVETTVPHGWCVSFSEMEGNLRVTRMTFPEWANDDRFFERLVDDDATTVAIYEARRLRL